jgi:hypothetical protein
MDDVDLEVDPLYCIFDRLESSNKEIAIAFSSDCANKIVERLNNQ